jgi:hypothetical protein
MAQYPAASTTVTVNPSRLVTKSSTAGQTLLSATAVTSSTDATMGSWVQVTASTSAEYYISSVAGICTTTTGSGWYGPILVDVAIGGAGSESVIASVVLMGSQTYSGVTEPAGMAPLGVPLRVAAGTRLAVRASVAGTGTTTRSVLVYLAATTLTNTEGN